MNDKQRLISDLQSLGLQIGPSDMVAGRIGGAGPSDHAPVTIFGTTVMVPVHTLGSKSSPYRAQPIQGTSHASLSRDGDTVANISFPPRPRFYDLSTEDGIPYWMIAQLHASDVLATTVLQTCFRYTDPARRCQFCAIGESLQAGRTIARKTPAQLSQVAEAARRLDGITHVVMTTGTPDTPDRGASVLCDCASAISERTGLPIQAQLEPPDSFEWFQRLKDCGVDSLGMHLEVIEPTVRARVMPSKAEVDLETYFDAFRAAVPVFGRAQVSTYLLAGLGDSVPALLKICRTLIEIGVYPFVVPFVPISNTRLQHHPSPSPTLMRSILEPLGRMLAEAEMTSDQVRAGCAKCGACSSLSAFEACSA